MKMWKVLLLSSSFPFIFVGFLPNDFDVFKLSHKLNIFGFGAVGYGWLAPL